MIKPNIMKKFNQVITVEVSVDSIAQLLLQSMSADFKHKELVAETIIGSSLNAGNISYVYNALNGYTNEIDFKVGEEVECSEDKWDYENGEEKRISIGKCLIKSIDLYQRDKLTVEFTKTRKDGTKYVTQTTVSHLKCNKIPLEM